MKKLKLGELCAGYGGLGMAVEDVFNADTAWFSEFDEAPSKILAHHWPHVPNYGDMTKIDWAKIEPVDIISGGTPCQDLSAAGRRAGMNEGTRSNLWVTMREAIAIQRPSYVAWENVRGAFSAEASSSVEQCPGCVGDTADGRVFLRALGRVLGDLSDLGYDTQWRGLRAADVGACHGRFRVFVLAQNRDGGRSRRWPSVSSHGEAPRADAPAVGADYRIGGPGPSASADLSDALCGGCARRAREERRPEVAGATAERAGEGTAWGEYEPAIRQWERALGRAAPRPTEPTGRNGTHRLSPRFTEWMMGLPDGWVTDPAIGISRNEQLKACGNGVVPQQAMAALRDMLRAFQEVERAA